MGYQKIHKMAKIQTSVGVVEYAEKNDWRITKAPPYPILKKAAEKIIISGDVSYLKFGDYAVMFTAGDNYVGDWDTEMELLKDKPGISGISSKVL